MGRRRLERRAGREGAKKPTSHVATAHRSRRRGARPGRRIHPGRGPVPLELRRLAGVVPERVQRRAGSPRVSRQLPVRRPAVSRRLRRRLRHRASSTSIRPIGSWIAGADRRAIASRSLHAGARDLGRGVGQKAVEEPDGWKTFVRSAARAPDRVGGGARDRAVRRMRHRAGGAGSCPRLRGDAAVGGSLSLSDVPLVEARARRRAQRARP
jgi:hypothetical protein